METQKIETRLQRILEQIPKNKAISKEPNAEGKSTGEIRTSSSKETDYEQSTTFNDHSDWSDSWD